MDAQWLARERATATCVQTCFDEFVVTGNKRGPDDVLAVCKLTWITSASNGENTARVVAPALAELLGRSLSARAHGALLRELTAASASSQLRSALSVPVGFTNFYNAFRNYCRTWMAQNSTLVLPILERARKLKTDSEAREIYQLIQDLPHIHRQGANLAAANLLTPVVACLDPRARCPVINGRATVRKRLKTLGLANQKLTAQFIGLIKLIGGAGFRDAFELDLAPDSAVAGMARGRFPGRSGNRYSSGISRSLNRRDITEVNVLQKVLSHRCRRVHNEMTNALRLLLEAAGKKYDEGARMSCLYDARVLNYDGKGRDLLIEVKAATELPFCRMAVGQLLDYSRQLTTHAQTDLAALFPSKPSSHALNFMQGIGVRVAWFVHPYSDIDGDWTP